MLVNELRQNLLIKHNNKIICHVLICQYQPFLFCTLENYFSFQMYVQQIFRKIISTFLKHVNDEKYFINK